MMSDGIITTKALADNIYKKNKPFFQGEKYAFWNIKKDWEKIVVAEMVYENSLPKSLFNGQLVVEVWEYNTHYFLNTYKDEIIKSINKYIGIGVVENLEILSIKKKLNRILNENCEKENIKNKKDGEEKSSKKFFENEKNVEKLEEEINLEDIEIDEKEIKEIDENIGKIDKKYGEIAESLRKIAIKMKKRNKYLLTQGYKKCESCGAIFYPRDSEKICFECYGKIENEKLNSMKNLIKENPYISEKDAVRFTKTDNYTYYKARDILAQQMYYELLYFSEQTNVEIEVNKDYSNEIRNEAKIDFEVYVKYYIDFRVGTDNIEVFKIERKKLLKKLKKELDFRKQRVRK